MNEEQQTVVKKCSFVMAMRHHFGYRPGEGLKQFSEELKSLTAEDKAELKTLLTAEGFTITE